MGLLDIIANRSFRDDPAGRVVVFGGGLRNRGYLVRSKTDELKIRSFIKMFSFAEISIQLLGTLSATAWLGTFSHASGRLAEQAFRAICIYLGFYSLVAVLPILLLWRAYRRERFCFVSPEDEVLVTSEPPRDQRFFRIAALVAISILILMGAVFFLVRSK